MTGMYSAEMSVEVPAAPDEVFGYFTDPGRYVRWMGAEARLEPVPGGQYHVRMPDGFAAAGEFARVDPPQQVIFTWGFADDDGHQIAWETYLPRLVIAASGGDPGPDPHSSG